MGAPVKSHMMRLASDLAIKRSKAGRTDLAICDELLTWGLTGDEVNEVMEGTLEARAESRRFGPPRMTIGSREQHDDSPQNHVLRIASDHAIEMSGMGLTELAIWDGLLALGFSSDQVEVVMKRTAEARADACRPIEQKRKEALRVATLRQIELTNRVRPSIGMNEMLAGASWIGLGIAISLASMSFASRHGGFYIVTWGPSVYGAIRFVRGLLLWSADPATAPDVLADDLTEDD